MKARERAAKREVSEKNARASETASRVSALSPRGEDYGGSVKICFVNKVFREKLLEDIDRCLDHTETWPRDLVIQTCSANVESLLENKSRFITLNSQSSVKFHVFNSDS